MANEPPCKIFVRGIAASVDENGLELAFSKYGRIMEVQLLRDRETKAPRGLGFITFECTQDCDDAVLGMNGQALKGSVLQVSIAFDKPGYASASRGTAPFRGRGQRGTGVRSAGPRMERGRFPMAAGKPLYGLPLRRPHPTQPPYPSAMPPRRGPPMLMEGHTRNLEGYHERDEQMAEKSDPRFHRPMQDYADYPPRNNDPNLPRDFDPNRPRDFDPNAPGNFDPNPQRDFDPYPPRDYDPYPSRDYDPNPPRDYDPNPPRDYRPPIDHYPRTEYSDASGRYASEETMVPDPGSDFARPSWSDDPGLRRFRGEGQEAEMDSIRDRRYPVPEMNSGYGSIDPGPYEAGRGGGGGGESYGIHDRMYKSQDAAADERNLDWEEGRGYGMVNPEGHRGDERDRGRSGDVGRGYGSMDPPDRTWMSGQSDQRCGPMPPPIMESDYGFRSARNDRLEEAADSGRGYADRHGYGMAEPREGSLGYGMADRDGSSHGYGMVDRQRDSHGYGMVDPGGSSHGYGLVEEVDDRDRGGYEHSTLMRRSEREMELMQLPVRGMSDYGDPVGLREENIGYNEEGRYPNPIDHHSVGLMPRRGDAGELNDFEDERYHQRGGPPVTAAARSIYPEPTSDYPPAMPYSTRGAARSKGYSGRPFLGQFRGPRGAAVRHPLPRNDASEEPQAKRQFRPGRSMSRTRFSEPRGQMLSRGRRPFRRP